MAKSTPRQTDSVTAVPRQTDSVTAVPRLVTMSTGKVRDYDAIPNFCNENHKPGKWDSDTLMPCDQTALDNMDYSGMNSPDAKAQLKEGATNHFNAIQAQLEKYSE